MLGGASIVTFYSAVDKDRKKWAIGANNPNVAYRALELKKFGDKFLTGLLKRTSDKDDPNHKAYRVLKKLLDIAYHWLIDEIDDPNFIERHRRFSDLNDADSTDLARYQAAPRAQYQVHVPAVVDTGVNEIRWLKEISGGKTFNALYLEFLNAKTDREMDKYWALLPKIKEIAATIGQNFIHQLDSLLVHSDIHPGQFIVVDSDGTINILDTKNLIEFGEKESEEGKKLLKFLFEEWKPGQESRQELLDIVTRFFKSAEKDEKESFEKVKEQVLSEVEGKTPEEIVADILWILIDDVTIPRIWIYVIKNFLNLNRIAKDAEFDNLMDMLLYNPANPGEKHKADQVLRTAQRIAPNATRDIITPEMIRSLTGKRIRDMLKNSVVVEAIKKKAGWVRDLVRKWRGRTITADERHRAEDMLARASSRTRINLTEEAKKLAIERDLLLEIIGPFVTRIEGTEDDVIKNEPNGDGSIDDGAMLANGTESTEAPGGIDLNLPIEKVQIKKTSENAPLFDPALLDQPNIKGLTPVIINVAPVGNWQFLLGVSTVEPHEQLSKL
jgi:hypothetical protein